MPGIDLHKILRDSLQAIQPVAEEKEITILFDHTAEPLMTTLPLDEVLAPVLSLTLHLIYILPKGRKISLAIMERYDSEAGIFYLRIELKLGWFSINPNLIFKPDKNRFKLEQGENHESKIFIEWPLEEKTKSIPVIKPPFSNNGFETAVKENADLLDVSEVM